LRLWNGTLEVRTAGRGETVDLTGQLEEAIASSGVRDGQGTVFVPGSTAGITTIEYESGVVRDLQNVLERLAPEGTAYHHDKAWGDGNGYAHVRAALLGPSLAFLVRGGELVRGTWQQVVLCDFDNRPRSRRVEIQLIGTDSPP
jgi:secondary thiamine-phosphate synthase enzyme